MAGNWKMYKTAAETSSFFEKFLPMVAAATHAEIAICPPFVNLPAAVHATQGSAVEIGAHQIDAVMRFGPISDDDVFKFLVKKLFGGFFPARFHFDEVGEDAQGFQFLGVAMFHCCEEPLHTFRGVGAMQQNLRRGILAGFQTA